MKILLRCGGVVLMLALLVACGGQSGTSRDDGLSGQYGGEEAAAAAATQGAGDEGLREGSAFEEGAGSEGPVGGPSATAQDRLVYFEFDRSEVADQYRELLAAHGRYLAAHPNARLRLEGHADERGSREYNIGLGERRAQAVRDMLLLLGASADQLSTVSYGEERPAVQGSNEEAWRANRRVELVYRG